jgi:CRISPR-associated protein Csm4
MARLPFSILGEPEEKQAKPMKKIQFLGKNWFEKVLHNESATIDSDLNLKADKSFLSSLYGGKVTMSNVTQRVTIQPDHIKKSEPFFTERLHFNEQAGLFFLIEWENSAIKDLFYSAIRLLGDLGIGTDRAVGNGFFTSESTTLRMRLPEATTHQCALGLYLPKEHELSNSDIEQSAWAITKRGGYMAGASDTEHITLRKRSVYMFEVGSIFPNKKLEGKRVDLRPEWNEPMHPVWRVGKPIFVPISIP